VLHYIGCLPFWRRESFFDDDSPYWVYETTRERQRQNKDDGTTIKPETEEEVQKKIKRKKYNVAVAIEAEYKRFAVLRRAVQTDDIGPTSGVLLKNIQSSLMIWRASPEYRRGKDGVRAWSSDILGRPERDEPIDIVQLREKLRQVIRANASNPGAVPSEAEVADDEEVPYSLERDIKAYAIQFEKTEQNVKGKAPGSTKKEMVYTRVEEPLSDNRFRSQFPDQRISVEYLLDGGEDNVLWRKRTKDRIRHFHFPCNNMLVSF
jgi:hypothetical protein